ncbi:MAG TPA: hypothetical protein VLX92_16295, partial [Kofleriaceae bacterium]|nr:hypothetical protein [Kofleriaceae bacterium]
WDDGAIDVTCTAPQDAYAVVSSTAARGWSAELDGEAVAWRVADVLRRAIAIPRGTHRVAWRYAAPGLAPGLALAAAGLALLAALGWLSRSRTPDRAPRATT